MWLLETWQKQHPPKSEQCKGKRQTRGALQWSLDHAKAGEALNISLSHFRLRL